MKKKQKLQLSEVKIKSFITTLSEKEGLVFKGGNPQTGDTNGNQCASEQEGGCEGDGTLTNTTTSGNGNHTNDPAICFFTKAMGCESVAGADGCL